MNSKPCPICGSNLTEQRWKAKSSGKDCHAWRHEDKNPQCEDPNTHKPFIDWIPEKKSYSNQSALAKSEDYQNLLNANRKLYALILAVAHCLNVPQENIDAEIKRMEYQGK